MFYKYISISDYTGCILAISVTTHRLVVTVNHYLLLCLQADSAFCIDVHWKQRFVMIIKVPHAILSFQQETFINVAITPSKSWPYMSLQYVNAIFILIALSVLFIDLICMYVLQYIVSTAGVFGHCCWHVLYDNKQNTCYYMCTTNTYSMAFEDWLQRVKYDLEIGVPIIRNMLQNNPKKANLLIVTYTTKVKALIYQSINQFYLVSSHKNNIREYTKSK